MSRRLIACLTAAAVAVPAVGATAVSAHKGDDRGHDGHHKAGPLFAVLKGKKEIAPDGTRGVGDPDGIGSATVLFHKGSVCFGITVANIDTPNAAHIHRGTRDMNGPVVVPLTAPASGDPGASSGCAPVPDELAREIQDHPRGFYVNVHTAAFPGGAVRGQLRRR